MTAEIIHVAQSIAAKLLGFDEVSGNKEKAREHLNAFASSNSRQGDWTAIEKLAFCQRMADLIEKPFLINQQGSGYCQSVAPLYVMALCYPARFCSFAVGLYETGTGRYGDLSISMASGLRAGDLKTINEKWKMHLVDLMLTLAMREYQNNLLTIDDVNDSYAYAIGTAVEMEEPVEGSGLFSIESFDSDVAGFQALSKDAPSFVLAEGSISVFSTLSFGGHAAVLLPDITTKNGEVTFQFWSWGNTQSEKVSPASAGGWRRTTVSSSRFNALGEAYHVIPNQEDDII